MPDLWFVVGLAFGIVLTGFCAIGSFERGADSVRTRPWKHELVARKRAYVASLSARTVTAPALPGIAFRVPVADRPTYSPLHQREQELTRIAL